VLQGGPWRQRQLPEGTFGLFRVSPLAVVGYSVHNSER
jgi:hypothetical protein